MRVHLIHKSLYEWMANSSELLSQAEPGGVGGAAGAAVSVEMKGGLNGGPDTDRLSLDVSVGHACLALDG